RIYFVFQVNVQSTQRHPETPVNVAGFHFPSKKPVDGVNVQRTQTETKTSNSDEFNSFQFWRAPLPPIDSELLDLLDPVEALNSKNTRTDTRTDMRTDTKTSSVAADGDEFNSFQFWREPVASIDGELLDLL
ncbi:protein AF1q, partial [Plectropomus leopardus]|uniref:protein AF1q n=1 Tax=Plectropomus leopardus TaxID=160734 RepID=UPI001C4C8F63